MTSTDSKPVVQSIGLTKVFKDFWHRDRVSGQDTPLAPGTALERLRGIGQQVRFAARPYPDLRAPKARNGERRLALPAWLNA